MSTTVEKIMSEVYGTGVGIFNPITILWASQRAMTEIPVAQIKAELKEINVKRTKLSLPVAVHEFGHQLF